MFLKNVQICSAFHMVSRIDYRRKNEPRTARHCLRGSHESAPVESPVQLHEAYRGGLGRRASIGLAESSIPLDSRGGPRMRPGAQPGFLMIAAFY